MLSSPCALKTNFIDYISTNGFPCVAAKDAARRGSIKIFVADHMGCPHKDEAILSFLYEFTKAFRKKSKGFHSAAIIFPEPAVINEDLFEELMWARLNALHEADKLLFCHDTRVDADPSSPNYSFSLMAEAFFIIGLHPQNSRPSRRFECPVLIFNPHIQFEDMRKTKQYEKMQAVVRKKDIAIAGSVNPMLTDFGNVSEVFQYSGRAYSNTDRCPFKLNNHESN